MPNYVYFERKCSISGTKSDLSVIRLMDPSTDLADATDEEMARMEWAWGMERGGLDYYLSSAPNDMYLRDDIAEMYLNAEFLVLPTPKTYKDAMEFRERAGYCDRHEEDRSPLRPISALGRLFRYVFVPITDAAEELARQIFMQCLTDEDLNGGVHPCTGRPMDPHLRRYLVVESHCHLFSICYFARIALGLAVSRGRSVDLWDLIFCLSDLAEKWGIGRRNSPPAPRWFVDSAMREDDDESLPESQTTGYWPLLRSTTSSLQHVAGCALSRDVPDWEKRSRILKCIKDSPQRKVAPQRSARLGSTPIIHNSAARRVKSNSDTKTFAPREEPGWTEQNGRFPTRQFTSNDWALFCFGTWLSEDDDGYTH
ncbi:hypothetical protein EV122DRAFT_282915 [Schizophyllum commune]